MWKQSERERERLCVCVRVKVCTFRDRRPLEHIPCSRSPPPRLKVPTMSAKTSLSKLRQMHDSSAVHVAERFSDKSNARSPK